jgi:hypothetical protein
MKKDTSFYWDESYTNAFKKIKEYLLNLPALQALVSGHQLILFVAAQIRLGVLLAQQND